MKNLYTVLTITIMVMFGSKASSQVITAIVNSGRWDNTSTWDLGRLPGNNDTVIIPANVKVILESDQDNSTCRMVINVFGEIEVKNNGKLSMNAQSLIDVKAGGKLSAHPGGSSNDGLLIGGVMKFDGNDANIVGPQWANSSTGTTPNGFTSSTLPVKFLSFNVAARNHDVLVQWSTAEEANSSHFEIQRSNNGIDWTVCGVVSAAGFSSIVKNYSFTDRIAVNGIIYYRLRQVDNDGAFLYTQVRVLKKVDDTQLMIHASNDRVFVHFSKQFRGLVSVNIFNLNGQVMARKVLNDPVGEFTIATTCMSNGVYVVQVTDGNALSVAKKIPRLGY